MTNLVSPFNLTRRKESTMTHKHTHHHAPIDHSGASRFLPEVAKIKANAPHAARVRNIALAATAYARALADLQAHK